MGLSPNSKISLMRLGGRSLARFIRLVEKTSRVVSDPPQIVPWLGDRHPIILACWHGQFMMLRTVRPEGVPVKAMVARHGDAEVIGEAMSRLGIELIRGAGAGSRRKDRGGAHALRAAVRALDEGASLVMTADVPPGPARRAGEGIITIARLSGRPIVPVAAATTRFKVLDTWSRMTINLPYSTLAFAAGEPIHVPRDADAATLETLRVALETSLNEATRKAYQLAGADVARIEPKRPRAADAPPAAPGFGLNTYRRATHLMKPLAPALLALRERQGKEDPARRPERLGRPGMPRPAGTLVWVHAASVGETNAILPLVHALGARRPALRFLLTTGTVTSANIAAQRLGPAGIHQFVPLDAAPFARSFLDHWRPDLAVFTESEIWPNLVLETSARNIPMVLVNARMSGRSFKRWKRRPGMSEPLFSRFDVVLAQNETLARRFVELGARRVEAAGNLKLDAPPPPVDDAARHKLKTSLAGRPVLLAASTHEGEDAIITEAHLQLAATLPGLCTIIAPRHPARGPAIADAIARAGLKPALRSAGALPAPEIDIYVADTIGELGTLYSLAPVAFIGGSLIPHGGQNPIEAIRHGAAVLTGPHWHNFKDAYAALLRHKGAIEVTDAGEIAEAAGRLFADSAALSAVQAGANAALGSLSGALARSLDVLIGLLPPDEGLRRAG